MKYGNLLFKRTITRIANSKNLSREYKTIAKLDEDDYLIKYYSDYCDELENLENGIFLALVYMKYRVFENVKYLWSAEKYPDEFCNEYILITHKNRRLIRIPEYRCPCYGSPEIFGVKIKKVDDEYKITYGMLYDEEYIIDFNRGYEDIEIVYAEELKIAEEYDNIPSKFIPFKDNTDELDMYSRNNILNPHLERLMYSSLKFRF